MGSKQLLSINDKLMARGDTSGQHSLNKTKRKKKARKDEKQRVDENQKLISDLLLKGKNEEQRN